MTGSTGVCRFEGFRLDAGRRLLERVGEAVEIQPKVFETLLYLVRHADQVVTKDDLLDSIWSGSVVTEGVLTRVMSAVRKALGDDAGSPRFVRAVRGVGYRFVATVEAEAEPAAEPRPRSLAVLPFRALKKEDRDESLELGMADTLIARLSVIPDLIVRPLSTVRSCVDGGRSALEVARWLDVEAVLEASLQTGGERLRVNARLLSARDGKSLWSESFDQRFADVFDLQDVMCNRIADRLLPHFTGEEALPGWTERKAPEAYREYLEGRLFMGRHTPGDIRRAMKHFEKALDMAPAYAEAWASLGECHELLGTEGGSSTAEHYSRARQAAQRALALAPGLPDAECLLAKIAWQHDWDWSGAEARFRRALDRYPNRADLHTHYSNYCSMMGRAADGVEHARRALEIDPVSPWSNALLAQALHMAGDCAEALRQAHRTLELAPGFHFAMFFAGLSEFSLGNRDRGIQLLQEAAESGRDDFYGALGASYAVVGRREDALGVLETLAARGESSPLALAIVHLACGNLDEGAALLELCVERKHWHALLMHSDPLFAELRGQDWCRRLIERLGLPDA